MTSIGDLEIIVKKDFAAFISQLISIQKTQHEMESAIADVCKGDFRSCALKLVINEDNGQFCNFDDLIDTIYNMIDTGLIFYWLAMKWKEAFIYPAPERTVVNIQCVYRLHQLKSSIRSTGCLPIPFSIENKLDEGPYFFFGLLDSVKLNSEIDSQLDRLSATTVNFLSLTIENGTMEWNDNENKIVNGALTWGLLQEWIMACSRRQKDSSNYLFILTEGAPLTKGANDCFKLGNERFIKFQKMVLQNQNYKSLIFQTNSDPADSCLTRYLRNLERLNRFVSKPNDQVLQRHILIQALPTIEEAESVIADSDRQIDIKLQTCFAAINEQGCPYDVRNDESWKMKCFEKAVAESTNSHNLISFFSEIFLSLLKIFTRDTSKSIMRDLVKKSMNTFAANRVTENQNNVINQGRDISPTNNTRSSNLGYPPLTPEYQIIHTSANTSLITTGPHQLAKKQPHSAQCVKQPALANFPVPVKLENGNEPTNQILNDVTGQGIEKEVEKAGRNKQKIPNEQKTLEVKRKKASKEEGLPDPVNFGLLNNDSFIEQNSAPGKKRKKPNTSEQRPTSAKTIENKKQDTTPFPGLSFDTLLALLDQKKKRKVNVKTNKNPQLEGTDTPDQSNVGVFANNTFFGQNSPSSEEIKKETISVKTNKNPQFGSTDTPDQIDVEFVTNLTLFGQNLPSSENEKQKFKVETNKNPNLGSSDAPNESNVELFANNTFVGQNSPTSENKKQKQKVKVKKNKNPVVESTDTLDQNNVGLLPLLSQNSPSSEIKKKQKVNVSRKKQKVTVKRNKNPVVESTDTPNLNNFGLISKKRKAPIRSKKRTKEEKTAVPVKNNVKLLDNDAFPSQSSPECFDEPMIVKDEENPKEESTDLQNPNNLDELCDETLFDLDPATGEKIRVNSAHSDSPFDNSDQVKSTISMMDLQIPAEWLMTSSQSEPVISVASNVNADLKPCTEESSEHSESSCNDLTTRKTYGTTAHEETRNADIIDGASRLTDDSGDGREDYLNAFSIADLNETDSIKILSPDNSEESTKQLPAPVSEVHHVEEKKDLDNKSNTGFSPSVRKVKRKKNIEMVDKSCQTEVFTEIIYLDDD